MTLTHGLLRMLAAYSEGCRLAVEFGSHSGVVFEYTCENRPQGKGVVGRWIDRRFLELWGSRRLRLRLEEKKRLLAAMIEDRRAAERPVTVLDVASGTGRALRELCADYEAAALTVVCHDRDPRKVMQGRELVAQEKLANVTFAVGDATDAASYLILNEPDIVLATGLFPLLQRDDAVRTVIRLAFEHLREGGYFVCTATRHRDPASSRWDGPLAPPIVDRPVEAVAGWLRASGFAATRVERRSAGEPLVIGVKGAEV